MTNTPCVGEKFIEEMYENDNKMKDKKIYFV